MATARRWTIDCQLTRRHPSAPSTRRRTDQRPEDMTMDRLWQDVRFAARSLSRAPALTVVAIFTLAFGIGANTAVFSLVNTVLICPLPYVDPDRLVMLFETRRGDEHGNVSPHEYVAWCPREPLVRPTGDVLLRVVHPERARRADYGEFARRHRELLRRARPAPTSGPAHFKPVTTSPVRLNRSSSVIRSGRRASPAIRASWAGRRCSTTRPSRSSA